MLNYSCCHVTSYYYIMRIGPLKILITPNGYITYLQQVSTPSLIIKLICLKLNSIINNLLCGVFMFMPRTV